MGDIPYTECLQPPYIKMKIINFERLTNMIQDMNDLNDLAKLGLTNEDIEGYLYFFATNIVNPLTTVFEDSAYEKHQR